MSRVPFPGYPKFLEAAAIQIGHPEAEIPARRDSTLAAVANLCAQASQVSKGDARAILEKASNFRDQLHAAATAADLMIAEVAEGLGLNQAEVSAGRDPRQAAGRRSPSPGASRITS